MIKRDRETAAATTAALRGVFQAKDKDTNAASPNATAAALKPQELSMGVWGLGKLECASCHPSNPHRSAASAAPQRGAAAPQHRKTVPQRS